MRFFGDDLDPEEITAALGTSPTVGVRKGGVWFTSRGVEKLAPRGSWRRHVPRRAPGDLDAQIAELLAPLTPDLSIWRDLSARYQADIFCGLFMKEGNEGWNLSPKTLIAVGNRGLLIDFDTYAPKAADGVEGLS